VFKTSIHLPRFLQTCTSTSRDKKKSLDLKAGVCLRWGAVPSFLLTPPCTMVPDCHKAAPHRDLSRQVRGDIVLRGRALRLDMWSVGPRKPQQIPIQFKKRRPHRNRSAGWGVCRGRQGMNTLFPLSRMRRRCFKTLPAAVPDHPRCTRPAGSGASELASRKRADEIGHRQRPRPHHKPWTRKQTASGQTQITQEISEIVGGAKRSPTPLIAPRGKTEKRWTATSESTAKTQKTSEHQRRVFGSQKFRSFDVDFPRGSVTGSCLNALHADIRSSRQDNTPRWRWATAPRRQMVRLSRCSPPKAWARRCRSSTTAIDLECRYGEGVKGYVFNALGKCR